MIRRCVFFVLSHIMYVAENLSLSLSLSLSSMFLLFFTSSPYARGPCFVVVWPWGKDKAGWRYRYIKHRIKTHVQRDRGG